MCDDKSHFKSFEDRWKGITSDLDGFTKGMNACLCWILSWLFCFFHRLSCNHEQDHRHCWYHLGETCILCLSWCYSCSISLISDSSGLLENSDSDVYEESSDLDVSRIFERPFKSTEYEWPFAVCTCDQQHVQQATWCKADNHGWLFRLACAVLLVTQKDLV